MTVDVRDEVGLADAASAGLGDDVYDEGPVQDALVEGEEGTKVRFIGMQYNQLDGAPRLGEKVAFTVTGVVVGTGEEQMANGHIRHYAKVAVETVRPNA